jgi:hypothetical protein
MRSKTLVIITLRQKEEEKIRQGETDWVGGSDWVKPQWISQNWVALSLVIIRRKDSAVRSLSPILSHSPFTARSPFSPSTHTPHPSTLHPPAPTVPVGSRTAGSKTAQPVQSWRQCTERGDETRLEGLWWIGQGWMIGEDMFGCLGLAGHRVCRQCESESGTSSRGDAVRC